MNNKSMKSHYTAQSVIKKYIETYLEIMNLFEINIIKLEDILKCKEYKTFLIKRTTEDIKSFLNKNENFYLNIKTEYINNYEKKWSIIESRFIRTLEALNKEIRKKLDQNNWKEKTKNKISKLLNQHKSNIINYVKLDILRSHYNRGIINSYDLITGKKLKYIDSNKIHTLNFIQRDLKKIELDIENLKIDEDYNIFIINSIPGMLFTPSSFILDDEVIFVGSIYTGLIILIKKP